MVRGGPGALIGAIVSLLGKHGGEVRTGAKVVRIVVRDGRAAGVMLASGEQLEAKAIVSAVDPRQTFLHLIEPDDLPPTFVGQIHAFRARGVTAKINLALSGMPDVPALRGDPLALRGRLLIAPGLEYLERAFDAAKYETFSDAPWLELSIPSVADNSLAPDGQHVMSIYVHFAPRILRDTQWSAREGSLLRTVFQTLESHIPGLEPLITATQVLTPEHLEQEWGLSGGHIFHGDSSLDQTWIARPLLGWSRYVTPLDGLFLGGAGSHPGGGLTGAAGWLAAEAAGRALTKK
jgi:phytoene dehydrogenase-like protein